jgi:hypothetical protein
VASDPQVVKRKFSELGSTGLKRWGGQVDEEFLPQLRGPRAAKVYREMRDNDPVVGAVVFAVDMLLRQISWRTEPASQDWEDLKAEQLLKDCMEDMSHTWEDMISEILSMLPYGWSWHEVIYKRRIGDVRNPQFRSRFNDGLIGWRKMPIRSQDTMVDWVFDEDGGVQALKQQAPPDLKEVTIPIGKSLLFRASSHKNNPEGRSILRNAYRPWYFKKRLEEIEGIGIERDLAGLPVVYLPAEMLSPSASKDDKTTVEMFKRLVRNVRRDEQEGLVLPIQYDEETKQPLYKFELVNSGGTRSINIDGAITRYEQRIAMTILADFILLGHEQVGSYALSVNKTGIFRTALNSWAQSIAEVFNRHEIPRLFALNGWDHLNDFPKVVPGEVDPPDLKELGAFIQQISGSGMTLFPDPDLEDFIRQAAKLPEKGEDAEWMQQQEQIQAQQMDALGSGIVEEEMGDEFEFDDEGMFL